MKKNSNNKGIYAFIGLLTFFIVKIILNYIGIENVPAPIIITLVICSYCIFLIQGRNKSISSKAKSYFRICSILLGIFFMTGIIMIVFLQYFYNDIERYKIIMLIVLIANLLSLCVLTFIIMQINKK